MNPDFPALKPAARGIFGTALWVFTSTVLLLIAGGGAVLGVLISPALYFGWHLKRRRDEAEGCRQVAEAIAAKRARRAAFAASQPPWYAYAETNPPLNRPTWRL